MSRNENRNLNENTSPVPEEREWQTRVAAMFAVSIVGSVAMYMEIDGAMVPAVSVMAIAGIAGYELGMAQAGKIFGGN